MTKLSIVVSFSSITEKYIDILYKNIEQTLKNIDFEVITTGCTSKSFNKNIKHIQTATNFKTYENKVTAINICQGQYVWFINAADTLSKINYSQILEKINPDFDVISFGARKNGVVIDDNTICGNKWIKLDFLKTVINDSYQDIIWLGDYLFINDIMSKGTVQFLPFYIYDIMSNHIIDSHDDSDEVSHALEIKDKLLNLISEDTAKIIYQKCLDIIVNNNVNLGKVYYNEFAGAGFITANGLIKHILNDNSLKDSAKLQELEKLLNINSEFFSVVKSYTGNHNITINTFNFFNYLENHPIAQACVDSWKKLMPYAKIKIWTLDELMPIIEKYGFTKFAYDKGHYTFLGDVARIHLSMQNPDFLYLDLDTFMIQDCSNLLHLDAFTVGFPSDTGKLRCNYGCVYWQRKSSELSFKFIQKYMSDEFDKISDEQKLRDNDACTFSESVINTDFDKFVTRQLIQGCTVIHQDELSQYFVHVGLSTLSKAKPFETIYYTFNNDVKLLAKKSYDLSAQGITDVFILNARSGYLDSVNGVNFHSLIMPSSFTHDSILNLVRSELQKIKEDQPFELIEIM